MKLYSRQRSRTRCAAELWRLFVFLMLVTADTSAGSATTLYQAARDGDVAGVRAALQSGAQVNAPDGEGNTALHYAAAGGHDGMVELLIANGANINATSARQQTPLSEAVGGRHPSTMALLINAGADVSARLLYNQTVLHLAVSRGSPLDGIAFLLDHQADINAADIKGSTALHLAVQYGRRDVFGLLLDRRADVKARTSDGDTALHMAAYRGAADMTQLLIDHGADVNGRNSREETPLHAAAGGSGAGDFAQVARTLLDHGADHDAASIDFARPLHNAALHERQDVAGVLAEHRANVNAAKQDGQTPLHVAAGRRNEAIVTMLLDHGADVNRRANDGSTPLHQAAQRGNVAMITLLLARGADPLAQAATRGTPLNVALSNHYPDAAALLRDQQLAAMERQSGPRPTPTPWVDTHRGFRGLMFSDMRRGYVFGTEYMNGESSMLATDDGGTTWRIIWDFPHYRPADDRVPDVDRTKDGIWDVAFLDSQHFWVRTLLRKLYRTSDGGRTFELLTPDLIDPFSHEHITSWVDTGLQFLTETEGWALAAANLHKTTDGGRTWRPMPVPRALGMVVRAWFFDVTTGIATTGRGFQGVVRTTDGGRSWAGVPDTPSFDLLSCTRDGFCAGFGARQDSGSFLMVSNDRGRTWQDTQLTLQPGDRERIKQLQAVPPNLVILVGEDRGYSSASSRDDTTFSPPYPQVKSLLLKWDGSHWMRLTYTRPHEAFSGLYFLNADDGWFAASRAGLYKTEDGGDTLTYVADLFHQIAAKTPSPRIGATR